MPTSGIARVPVAPGTVLSRNQDLTLRPVHRPGWHIQAQIQVCVIDHRVHRAQGSVGTPLIKPLGTAPISVAAAQQRHGRCRFVADQAEGFLRIEHVEPQRIALARYRSRR